MPISRMLQPRQNYGLGSFVKKAVGKVTKPFTKLSKKIVPKEIAGIMRVAAPFLPPGYREAAYLMGTARQTGRITPVDLALTAAPTFFGKTDVGRGIAKKVVDIKVPFTEDSVYFNEADRRKSLREILVGGKAGIGETERVSEGIFGKGGEMFTIGKGTLPGTGDVKSNVRLLDTKAGQTLFGKPEIKEGEPTGDFKPSYLKIGSLGLSTYDLIKTSKSAEEAGQALVDATGDPDSYQIGYDIFTDLQPSVFDIPERFRLPAAEGGLMRENYALGSMPTAEESGLGGLPIEADMRYTGGFMPYGAKEKADDVPARLSKNEFVFTADAVRAAGGGSVQKGAQKMYNTMKQLESQPEAKGMMA